MTSETIAVEYSTVQECYHVGTFYDMLKHNFDAVRRGINNGYVLLGVFESEEKAHAFVDRHRKMHKISPMDVLIRAINNNEPF